MIIGQLKVIQGRNYINNQRLAHFVWNFHNPNNPYRKGYHVHHKDEDTLNDHISNLELMTISKHMGLHSSKRCGKLSPMYGRKATNETKLKMALSRKGKVHTEESKTKMSNIKLADKNPMYGTKHSLEWKENMSEKLKGRKRPPFSDEWKNKMSVKAKERYARKDFKPVSIETKLKISLANKGNKHCLGKKHSEETKRKMSESAKNRRVK